MRLHVRLALPLFLTALAVTIAGTIGAVRLVRKSYGLALEAQGRQLASITDHVLRGRARGLTETVAPLAATAKLVPLLKAKPDAVRADLAGWVDADGTYVKLAGARPQKADLTGLIAAAPTGTIFATPDVPWLVRSGDRLMVAGIAPGPQPGSFGILGHRLGQAYVGAVAELLRAEVTMVAGGRTVATTLAPDAFLADYHPVEMTLSTTGQWPVTFTFHVPARAMRTAERKALASTITGGAALFVIALAFYGWTVLRVTGPIRDLALAADRIAAGHLEDRLPANAPAEIGILIRQFNHMAAALKTAQDRLVHQAKLSSVGQMVAGISHELNNPLWGLIGHAEHVATLLKPGEPGREELDIVLAEANRMKRILADLRGFVRPGTGEREDVDLNSIATEVIALMRHDAERAGVEIDAVLSAHGAHTHASADDVRQIALNLSINALQAMRLGGKLRVETGRRDEAGASSAFITFTDTGPGLSQEVQAHLHEPFFSTKPGHLGLGLAICRNLAGRHGGSVRIDNRSGGGAIVELLLPAVASPRAA